MVPEISQIVPESLKVVPQPLIALTGKQTTSSSNMCVCVYMYICIHTVFKGMLLRGHGANVTETPKP